MQNFRLKLTRLIPNAGGQKLSRGVFTAAVTATASPWIAIANDLPNTAPT
jgi:hypothetical protein